MSDELSREERLELEEEGFVVSHPDNEDVQRIAVKDWENIVARITSPKDSVAPDSDGLDIGFNQLADKTSVVELTVKGDVVVRLVRVDVE